MNAIALVGVTFGLAECLVVAGAGLWVSARIWRETIGRGWEFVLKNMSDVVTKVRMIVAAAEGDANAHSCKPQDFLDFYRASERFRRALSPENMGTWDAAARDFVKTLERLFKCLEYEALAKILLVFGEVLTCGLSFMDLLLKVLKIMPHFGK